MKSARLKIIRSRTSDDVPNHLGPEGAALWSSVQSVFSISDPVGITLLRMAAEAADRVELCRTILEEDGLIVGGKPHPAVAIEKAAKSTLIRSLRELHLDYEPLRSTPGRPTGVVLPSRKAS